MIVRIRRQQFQVDLEYHTLITFHEVFHRHFFSGLDCFEIKDQLSRINQCQKFCLLCLISCKAKKLVWLFPLQFFKSSDPPTICPSISFGILPRLRKKIYIVKIVKRYTREKQLILSFIDGFIDDLILLVMTVFSYTELI